MHLQGIGLITLQSRYVSAERKRADHIYGIAREDAAHLDGLRAFGHGVPAPIQALAGGHHRRKKAFEMRGIERAHHQWPLPAPFVALRGENADEAELGEQGTNDAGAREVMRTLAQRFHRRIDVRDDHQKLSPEWHLVNRPVSACPFLEDEVRALGAELMYAADQRQAARAREGSNATWDRGGIAGERRHVGFAVR